MIKYIAQTLGLIERSVHPIVKEYHEMMTYRESPEYKYEQERKAYLNNIINTVFKESYNYIKAELIMNPSEVEEFNLEGKYLMTPKANVPIRSDDSVPKGEYEIR